MNSHNFLVIGGTGLIGSSLVRQFKCSSTSTQSIQGFYQLDARNNGDVNSLINNINPEVVINASGMTEVDMCEDYPELAKELNEEIVANLVESCRDRGANFVHISTDGVFDGLNPPYKEDDETNPLNIYGYTKLLGEEEALKADDSIILRISTPFGIPSSRGKIPFNTFIKNNLMGGKEIQVVTDQISTPTYIEDIAPAIKELLRRERRGIFNLGSTKPVSRYEFALRVAKAGNFNINLIKRTTLSEMKFKAKRAQNTSLDSSKISQIYCITPLELAISQSI